MEALILKIGDAYNKYYLDSDATSGLSLGRAFTNDIIITDPYVSESQLRIKPTECNEYNWHIELSGQTNPVFLNRKNIEAPSADLKSGDELTIGRTSITFYAEDHAVQATRTFSFTNWLHNHKFKPYIAILMLLILFGSVMLTSYLEITTEPDWGELATAASVFLLLALFWASVWSLTGRSLKADYYFSSHLFFTSLCLVLLLLLGGLGSYVDYIFSSPLLGEAVDWIVIALLGGLLIGFNLTLVTHSPRAIRKGMAVSLCIIGTIAAMVYMSQAEYSSKPSHSITIKPSFIPRALPVSIDQYIGDYDEIFNELALMKKEIKIELEKQAK